MNYLLKSPLCPHHCYCVHTAAICTSRVSPLGPACEGCGPGTGPLLARFTPRSIVLIIRSGFSHIVTFGRFVSLLNTKTRLG